MSLVGQVQASAAQARSVRFGAVTGPQSLRTGFSLRQGPLPSGAADTKRDHAGCLLLTAQGVNQLWRDFALEALIGRPHVNRSVKFTNDRT